MKSWPFYSNKYFQLSIIWSLITHVFFICFIGGSSYKSTTKKNNIIVQSIHIDTTSPKVEISSDFHDYSDELEINQDDINSSFGGITADFSLGDISINYDQPARLLNDNNFFDYELTPDNFDITHPLIVIKIWIDATGLVQKTAILSTQLDEFNSKKMAAKIGSQMFYPALKDGRGIASTKIYSIGIPPPSE